MFSDCSSLTSLNLSNINTNNVKDMGAMFYDSSSLSSLNTKDERILEEWKNQCLIFYYSFIFFEFLFDFFDLKKLKEKRKKKIK